jgi:Arc/MetJ-type ribon-helix-helix transcriptional regulator
MGRPPLGVKFTAIRLSPDVLAQIDAHAGKGKRSEFIREAVEEKLARDKA